MSQIILTARRGVDRVNTALDLLVSYTRTHTPQCLAEQIARRGIHGRANSTNHSPVGQWVLAQLNDNDLNLGHKAESFSWRGWLAIYNPSTLLIGEIVIPQRHPLCQLERQINDLVYPHLLDRGAVGLR